MRLSQSNSRFHAPATSSAAPSQVTHLAIGAHPDDLEIFAYHGIAACYDHPDNHFAGVTVTEGRGCSRSGPFADFSDDQMAEARAKEQIAAADLGRYAFVSLLGYQSADAANRVSSLIDDLEQILAATQPETLYLHNPADKHTTHTNVLHCSIEALRRLPLNQRPKKIYGCEVWRDLDWLDDGAKVALPVDRHPQLAKELIDVFSSQIHGGKEYTQATLGRRQANATFFEPRASDNASAYTFAIDLSELARDDSLTIKNLTINHLETFTQSVEKAL